MRIRNHPEQQNVCEALAVLAPQGVLTDEAVRQAMAADAELAELALATIANQTVYPACGEYVGTAICNVPVIDGRKKCLHTSTDIVFYNECSSKTCHNRRSKGRLCTPCTERLLAELDDLATELEASPRGKSELMEPALRSSFSRTTG